MFFFFISSSLNFSFILLTNWWFHVSNFLCIILYWLCFSLRGWPLGLKSPWSPSTLPQVQFHEVPGPPIPWTLSLPGWSWTGGEVWIIVIQSSDSFSLFSLGSKMWMWRDCWQSQDCHQEIEDEPQYSMAPMCLRLPASFRFVHWGKLRALERAF